MSRLKRKLALALAAALALACAGAAGAEENGWREGLSAAKPYEGVPEVDLSEKLGYIVYSPMNSQEAKNSCQRLFIYLPRKDVKAGDGLVRLYSEEDEPLWESAMSNEEAIEQRDMTSAELNSLLWGDGTCFVMRLPKSLELGKTYYINMEEGCIQTADGKLSNPEMDGKYAWRFAVVGDYGVNSMEYRRPIPTLTPEPTPEPTATPEPTDTPEPTATPQQSGTPDPAMTQAPSATPEVDPELEALLALANGITPEPTATPEIEYETRQRPEAGDEIHFELVIGGEAAEAVLYGYNGTVDFPLVTFHESGEVFGKVLKEDPAWGVMFLDDQGNELNRAEFR